MGGDRKVSCFEEMNMCRLSIWYNEIKVFVGYTFFIMK